MDLTWLFYDELPKHPTYYVLMESTSYVLIPLIQSELRKRAVVKKNPLSTTHPWGTAFIKLYYVRFVLYSVYTLYIQ